MISNPPNQPTSPYKKGDVLIQILGNASISQWLVLHTNMQNKYALQLIDKDGNMTSTKKLVSKYLISQYHKDALATRLLSAMQIDA